MAVVVVYGYRLAMVYRYTLVVVYGYGLVMVYEDGSVADKPWEVDGRDDDDGAAAA